MNIESFKSTEIKQPEPIDSFDIDRRIEPEQTSVESNQREETYDIDKRIKVSDRLVEEKKAGMDNLQKSESGEAISATEQDIPAPKEYTDDNGVVYRVGDELRPNTTFEVNGYNYETDDKGRIKSAEGQIRVEPPHPREWEDVKKMEKQEYKDTDDKGHLIAHWFGGSDKLENLIPMDAKLNRGDYNKLENTLAEAVKDGCNVSLNVEPLYEGDSTRPTEIRVTYIIDGEKNVTVFKNEREVSL